MAFEDYINSRKLAIFQISFSIIFLTIDFKVSSENPPNLGWGIFLFKKVKMKSILEEFWYGNIDHQMDATRDNKEVGNLLSLAVQNRDKLSEKLNDEEKEILEKIRRLHKRNERYHRS